MKIKEKQLASAWKRMLEKSSKKDWSDLNRAFLEFLRRKGMLVSLPRIVDELERIVFDESGIKRVLVRVMPGTKTLSIKRKVKSIVGGEVDIRFLEDGAILGGIVAESAEFVWDLSFRRSIKKMREQIYG